MLTTTPRHRLWPVVGLMGGLALFGCDTDETAAPIENDPLTQTEDINDPFGGFNSAREMSGFGDPFLMSEDGEVAVTDEMESDPAVQAMSDDADFYAVRIMWGRVDPDVRPVQADPIDWTGGASVETGAIIIRRTIAFEPIQGDHIPRPRDSRESIDWVSTTYGGMDGVQLLVIDSTNGAEPNSFTVSMPLFDLTIDVSELEEMRELYRVDENGNGVKIRASKVALSESCRRGWLSGLWLGLPADEQPDEETIGRVHGRFLGHWVTRQGEIGGAIRGFYGMNAEGHKVLFGKLIDHNGNFRGLLRGTWETSLDSGTAGSFQAHWLNFDRNVVGGMRGVWERRADEVGFFHGAWATGGCGAEEEDVEVDASIF